jgi:hypothetical protein
VIELYLRLAGATFVVLLPGLLLARALGRAGGAATIVWSLAVVFVGLLVAFALEASLDVALIVLALAAVAGAVGAAARGRLVLQSHKLAPAVVFVAGTVFGWLLWTVLRPVEGDAPFHLGRVRKLLELGDLTPERVGEFADGGLHPGYAFPLWHGFLALVARIADVDPELVVRHEAAVLAPLSFLVVYEAGAALFRSSWLGGAVLAAHVGLMGLSAAAGGAFKSLALPATAGGRQLLVPAALALVFAYLHDRSRLGLLTIGAAGLAVAVVHPSYALFLLIVLAGFGAARALLQAQDAIPIGVAAAAFAVPAVAFFVWLLPVVRDTASHTPTNAQLTSKEHGIERYRGQIDYESPDRYRLAPKVVARAGAVPVAALALVPLALLAIRRRWAAFVLGATVLPLAVLLSQELFPPFADAVSLSQARRLAGFLPFAFALAGAAAVLARLLSVALLPVALVAGIVLEQAFPGDFGYVIGDGGPTLVVWFALAGGSLALAAGAVVRRLDGRDRRDWLAPAAALLFVAPLAFDSASTWDDERPGPDELTPALVAALRANVEPGDVVFSDPETSYFVAASAPVYVAVAPPAHVADTPANRPHERRRDAVEFFREGSSAIPERYGADWVLVDGRRSPRFELDLPAVFRDGRYALYRFSSR